MLRLALRDVRTHWVRFVLSILAVLLATAFVAGTFALTDKLGRTLDELNTSTASADVYIRGRDLGLGGGGAFGPYTREPVAVGLADQAAAVDGVAAARPELFGTAYVVGADGTAVTKSMAPSFGWVAWPEFTRLQVLDGALPTGVDEIALDPDTLERSGYQVGDQAPLIVGQAAMRTVTIAGEVQQDFPMLGATIVFLSPDLGEAAYAATGTVPQIAVKAEKGWSTDAVVRAVQQAVGDGVEVTSGQTVRDEARTQTQSALGFVEAFMLAFALIALFVGSFLILNTFAMLVRQRQREFALLRALGASPSQVVLTLLAQAAVIGLVGAALGVAAGLGLVLLLQQVLARIGVDFSGAVSLAPERALAVLAAGVVVSCVAALVPARAAAATPPVAAMRVDEPRGERSLLLRAVLSAVVLGAGIWVVVLSVRQLSGGLLGLGAFGVLLGVLGMAPVIVPAVLAALAWPVRRWRPVGRLARGNVVRGPRRTAATAAALTIGMSLVSVAAVVAASATASTRSIVEEQFTADLMVSSVTSMLPEQVVGMVESVEGVGQAAVTRIGFPSSPDVDTSRGVASVPRSAMGTLFTMPLTAGRYPDGPGELLVRDDFARDENVRVGDRIAFTTPEGETELVVTGITTDQFFGQWFFVTDDAFAQMVPPDAAMLTGIALTAADGDAAALQERVTAALSTLPFATVLTGDELSNKVADQVNTVMSILYAMLGLSLVIAVLSIVNTLALAVIERTREIGLMRAVGLGRGQLAGIITLESVLTAVFGTLLGMVVGVTLAAQLTTIYADDGLRTLAIPWSQLGAMMGLTVVVGMLAAVWPAIKAARLPVLEAIATE